MKIIHMMAAAGIAVAALAGTAEARDYNHNGRPDRYDHNRGHGWKGNRHPVRCHTEWRHHHRVRICR